MEIYCHLLFNITPQIKWKQGILRIFLYLLVPLFYVKPDFGNLTACGVHKNKMDNFME